MDETIEITKISDTEYNMGLNTLTLLDGNIISVVAKGEQTTEVALLHKKICGILSSGLKGKISYMIDLNNCGKNSTEARKIWKELSEDDKTHKVATFGMNAVSRVIASFVGGNLTKGDLRFFKTKDEAHDWILS